jgi:hypothetical protein
MGTSWDTIGIMSQTLLCLCFATSLYMPTNLL